MIIAALILAAAVLAAAVVVAYRKSPLEALERRRAIVTLKSGASFGGVLFEVDRESLRLRNADLLTGGEQPVPVDGEVLILRADVAYLQLP